MKRILFFSMLILVFILACSSAGINVPAPISTMDVARIPTMIVETAQALATANTTTSTSIIPSNTPIVVTATHTATSTETSTASLTATSSSTAVSASQTVAPSATSIPPTAVSDCPVINAPYEAQVIELINAERAKVGLSALSAQSQLGSAARLHSTDMACNNYFNHTGLDGSAVSERAQREGYNWSYVGENIAAGYSTPESLVQGWMNSTGHKANILSVDYTEIGIGYAFGDASDYGSYWTAVFASP